MTPAQPRTPGPAQPRAPAQPRRGHTMAPGNYELMGSLGSGAFGDVFQAVCRKTGVAKAIKVIDPESMKFGKASVEIQALQQCHHANVIRLEEVLNDCAFAAGRTALVFPAYDMDLQRLIRLRRGFPEAFPERQRLSIAHDMWRGLEYLHSIQILHRDIKPANILVIFASSVHAVVADLGYACIGPIIVEGTGGLDSERTAKVCTDAYVAPELLATRLGVDEKAVYGSAVDVWSAAVVSFEIASLQRFCAQATTPANQFSCILRRLGMPPKDFHLPRALRKISMSEDTSIWSFKELLPPPWQNLVGECTRWNPNDRFSAAQVIDLDMWFGAVASEDTHAGQVPASSRDSTAAMPMAESPRIYEQSPLTLGARQPRILEARGGSSCRMCLLRQLRESWAR